MRLLRSAAALLVLAGCSPEQGERKAAEPDQVTFDGAVVSNAAAQAKHGERLTWVLGCRGCHGKNLQGHRFYERYASNLTRELPNYSKAEIERVIRTGVPRDGRELWGMPSDIFQHLSGADMTALIAELRALHPAGKRTQPPLPWTKDGRDEIAKGNLKPAAVFVRERKTQTPVDLEPSLSRGRYITMVTCAECHGPQLKGVAKFTPDLIVAGGYTREQFETLITTGVPVGSRKLGLMGEVARERFVHFTPHERDALYAYLRARAERE
ncbi:MAG: c-type cytochrome [Sphingomicrobium sp.]